MINKERLQELIEQNAIVWQLLCGVIYEYKLNKNYLVGVADDRISLMKICNEYEQELVDYITNLFETKEEARWHAEFGRIERTESLELPTWEEFTEGVVSVVFFDKRRIFRYGMDIDLGRIKITEYFYKGGDRIVFNEPLSKENYTLACRICKELFLGEKEC